MPKARQYLNTPEKHLTECLENSARREIQFCKDGNPLTKEEIIHILQGELKVKMFNDNSVPRNNDYQELCLEAFKEQGILMQGPYTFKARFNQIPYIYTPPVESINPIENVENTAVATTEPISTIGDLIDFNP